MKKNWQHLVKRFIAYGERESLQEAMIQTAKNRQKGRGNGLLNRTLVRFYRLLDRAAPDKRAVAGFADLSKNCRKMLIRQGFVRDADLIALLEQVLFVRVGANFDHYSLPEQKTILRRTPFYARKAAGIARKLNEPVLEAGFYISLGNHYDTVGKPGVAVKHYYRALSLFEKSTERSETRVKINIAGALSNLGECLLSIDRMAEAGKSLIRAVALWSEIDLRSGGRGSSSSSSRGVYSGKAGAFYNLAEFFEKRNDLENAVKYFEKALAALETGGGMGIGRRAAESVNGNEPLEHELDLLTTLNSLGLVLAKSVRIEESLKIFDRAFEIIKSLPVDRLSRRLSRQVYMAICNLADILRNRDDFERATYLYALARRLLPRKHGLADGTTFPTTGDRAYLLESMAISHNHLKQFSPAIGLYKKAIELYAKSVREEVPPVFAEMELIRASIGYGGALSEAGKSRQAEKVLLSTLKEIRRCRRKKDTGSGNREDSSGARELPDALLNLGLAFDGTGRLQESAECFSNAVKLYRKQKRGANQEEIAGSLHNLGFVLYKLGDLSGAEANLKKALIIRRKLSADDFYFHRLNVARSLSLLGVVRIAQDRDRRALGYFLKAEKIIESVMREWRSPLLRKNLFQEFADNYSNIQICYINLGEWQNALARYERIKSRSLHDLVNARRYLPPKPDAKAKTSGSKQKLRELNYLYETNVLKTQFLDSHLTNIYRRSPRGNAENFRSAVPAAQNKRTAGEAERKKLDLIEERKRILRQIREFDPNFPPSAEMLEYRDICRISRESRRTIVMFRVFQEATIIFIVFPNGRSEQLVSQEFTREVLSELTDSWLRSLRLFLSNEYNRDSQFFSSIENAPENNERVATESSSTAFFVLAEIFRLLLRPVYDTLKKTSYREILIVPNRSLAIFPLHACYFTENGAIKYLIDEFTFSYCETVSLFKYALDNRQKFVKKKKKKNFFFLTDPTFDLPFAREEVEAIKEEWNLKFGDFREFRGKRSAKKEIKKALTEESFDHYHFACHGEYMIEDPFSSSLRLRGGRRLLLKEMMELDLRGTALMVFSACRTGLVDHLEITDEHYGFSVGMILSGCSSVWTTLWSVDDRSAALLMQKAYKFLKKEQFSPARALRRAQLEFTRENRKTRFASPFYWAGYQHYGI